MQEVRYDGIRVSYIMPGSVATEFGGRGECRRSRLEDLTRRRRAGRARSLLTFPSRSLPSRVELRPSRPAEVTERG